MLQFQRDSEAAWSERHAELLEAEARGEEAVILARLRMRGRASGALTEQNLAFAPRLCDGLITRLAVHPDADSARGEFGWS